MMFLAGVAVGVAVCVAALTWAWFMSDFGDDPNAGEPAKKGGKTA